MAAGRRWGKTRLAAALSLEAMLAGKRVWWVAPQYKISEIGWREITALARQVPGTELVASERTIRNRYSGNGFITCRSADNPNSLRAEGLDFLVLDEAAYMDEQTWGEVLRPALMDRQGGALFCSTPRGRNWFYVLTQQPGPLWQSWHAPTSANPYISASELEQTRAHMTPRRYAQEVEAEFTDFEGKVFPSDYLTDGPCEPDVAWRTVFGIDWGRSCDMTQIVILDIATRRVVGFTTLSGDFHLQQRRVLSLVEKWRPVLVVAESNSIGQVLIDELVRADIPIVPFLTTNASKMQVIDSLALAMERREITLLADDEMRTQFENFCATVTPGGVTKYSAPEGLHDDLVIATALALWGADQAGAPFQAVLV